MQKSAHRILPQSATTTASLVHMMNNFFHIVVFFCFLLQNSSLLYFSIQIISQKLETTLKAPFQIDCGV